MNKHSSAERFGKYAILAISILIVMYASGSGLRANEEATEKTKWRALIPAIEGVLALHGYTCPGQRMQVGIVDAADVAGTSVALVGFCQGGAYTDWAVAMQLEGGQPVFARFRNAKGKIADLRFAQGASVMHGKDVKLAPEKHAIYDIAWDNDGMKSATSMRLKRCRVEAYVWTPKVGTFDYDTKLTNQTTRTYCRALEHGVH